MSNLIKVCESRGKLSASVVFVHGLGGHPYDTWRCNSSDVNSDKTFWPKWLGNDFPHLDVFTLDYGSSPSGWLGQTMPIEDRATNITELLLSESDLAESPIVLICHSLGGLIAKFLMLDLQERSKTRPEVKRLFMSIQKIVFMGTPHGGASHANFANILRFAVWPTALTRSLVSDAAALRRANNSYRLLAGNRQNTLKHKVFFEQRKTWLGKIVGAGSADPGLPNVDAVGIDADHFSLVKPRDQNSLSYKSICKFITNLIAIQPDRQDSVGEKLLLLPDVHEKEPIDFPGLAVRFISLVILGYLVWQVYHPPLSQPTDAQIWVAIAVVEDLSQRKLVAERLLKRPLSKDELALIQSLIVPSELKSALAGNELAVLENAKDEASLLNAAAKVNVDSCNGKQGFKVSGRYLLCSDGSPVPLILSKNTGGKIVSLEGLVFHFTATGESQTQGLTSILVGRDVDSGNNGQPRISIHLLVLKNGGVVQFLPFDEKAWHVGRSKWQNLSGLNSYTIGIDLLNWGRLLKNSASEFESYSGTKVSSTQVVEFILNGEVTYWEKFSPNQIDTSKALVRAFRSVYPNIAVLGHSEVSGPGKVDPGPAFPIEAMRNQN